MSGTSRVVWQEGMFLRAQHFQQQERWVEQMLRARTLGFGPYWWGFRELEINHGALGIGRFELTRAAGAFADGTPFAFPGGDAKNPPSRDLPDQVRDATVYLALPSPAQNAIQVADASDREERRLQADEFEAMDTHSGSPEPAGLVVGQLRLRLMLETEDRSGYDCIAVARVREVSSDRRVILDDQFIPPVLCCHTAAPLGGFITELVGTINQRSEELAARLTGAGSHGVADQADFLLLKAANRWLPLLRHFDTAKVLHPERLYESLVQMSGEFATFSAATMRPSVYPAYRHEDLQSSFAPVIAELRHSLSIVIGPGVTEIPLQEMRYGVRRGTITDRTILQDSAFYLVVRANAPGEAVRRLFPDLVKIGAIEQIRDLVAVAVTGIAVRPLPQAPRQLPFLPDANYFQLDRGSPHWAQMQNSAAFGIHVSNEFPNLRMQLWAVRA
jgi:type VI secretion system protein ImpJ